MLRFLKAQIKKRSSLSVLLWFHRLNGWLMKPLYGGSRYLCPLCGNGARRFRPLRPPAGFSFRHHMVGGLDGSDNAICPFCRRFDRERLVYLFLKRNSDLFHRPQSLLHVAPELKILERIRRHPHIRAVTIDLESHLVDARMDLQNLAFANDRFDSVICNHVSSTSMTISSQCASFSACSSPGGGQFFKCPSRLTSRSLTRIRQSRNPAERQRRFGADGNFSPTKPAM